MTLKEFLATADADHSIALQQARDYVQTEPVLYTANVMTMYIVGAGLYSVFSDTAETVGHPVRDPCMALMDRLRSEGEFNLTPGDPMGDANIQMLDGMALGLPDYSAQLAGLKAQLIAGSTQSTSPFASTTLYGIQQIRGDVPYSEGVQLEQTHAVITTVADTPRHSPRLFGLNPRTQAWEYVSLFRDVESVGIYDAKVPVENRSWPLRVEDPYSVVGA